MAITTHKAYNTATNLSNCIFGSYETKLKARDTILLLMIEAIRTAKTNPNFEKELLELAL